MPDTTYLPDGSYINWKTTEWLARVTAENERRLRQAAEEVRQQCRHNLSTPTAGAGPSAPGDFPHTDTGRLRDSVFVSVDPLRLEATIGTPLSYGVFLEFGTPGGQIVNAAPGTVLSWVDPRTGIRRYAKWVKLGAIRPRPWMRRTVQEMTSRLRAIFSAPLPDFDLG